MAKDKAAGILIIVVLGLVVWALTKKPAVTPAIIPTAAEIAWALEAAKTEQPPEIQLEILRILGVPPGPPFGR